MAGVGQVSFNGALARARDQDVTFVSERAVFRLDREGLVLTETAPGVRLKEDVLDQLGFAPHVHPALKAMDARLFRPGPMGLKRDLTGSAG